MKQLSLFALLISLYACGSSVGENNKPKSIREEYSGPWTEFWDNVDYNNKTNIAVIQTMNDNNLPIYKYHYYKASSKTAGKYLIALKKENSSNWEFYFIWPNIGKLEGPFKNDVNIDLPSIKKTTN